MRALLAAVLIAVPIVLVGWIVWRGQTFRRPEPSAQLRTPADEERALKSMFKSAGPARLKGEVQFFGPDTLFNAVDGAAPSFLQRGFRRLASATLALGADAGGELAAEVYDMRAPANAQAMQQAETSPTMEPVADWPEARRGSMALVYSAGRYYVKMTAFDAAAEAALPAVGRALREKLP